MPFCLRRSLPDPRDASLSGELHRCNALYCCWGDPTTTVAAGIDEQEITACFPNRNRLSLGQREQGLSHSDGRDVRGRAFCDNDASIPFRVAKEQGKHRRQQHARIRNDPRAPHKTAALGDLPEQQSCRDGYHRRTAEPRQRVAGELVRWLVCDPGFSAGNPQIVGDVGIAWRELLCAFVV
jgi:hypothetical protein